MQVELRLATIRLVATYKTSGDSQDQEPGIGLLYYYYCSNSRTNMTREHRKPLGPIVRLNLKMALIFVLILFSSSAFLVSSAYTGGAASSSNVEVAVANYGSMSVTVASGGKGVDNVSVGYEPLGQIGWDGRYFWIANFGSGSVALIKASDNMLKREISGFKGPAGVLYDPSNHLIYVADFEANTVYPVNDTSLVVGQGIAVGTAPEFMAYSPVTNEVYVANQVAGTVSVINSQNEVVKTITIGTPGDNGLSGIAYVPTTKSIYVIDYDDLGLYQISSNNKVVNFGIFSGNPWNLAFNPVNGMLYMTATSTGEILVVNPKTLDLRAEITCPGTICAQQAVPTGVAYDAQNGFVYVSDDANNILIPINGTKIVTPVIPTGEYPQGVTAGNPF